MRSALGVLSLLLAALAGCAPSAPQPGYVIRTPFDESHFAWASARGGGTVLGQAFMRTRGGEVKLAAGNPVYLLPANDYTREMQWAAATGTYAGWANRDPRMDAYRREVTADAQGRFAFRGLPAGAYIVSTWVFWQLPTRRGTLASMSGGVLERLIEVREGETVELVLAR